MSLRLVQFLMNGLTMFIIGYAYIYYMQVPRTVFKFYIFEVHEFNILSYYSIVSTGLIKNITVIIHTLSIISATLLLSTYISTLLILCIHNVHAHSIVIHIVNLNIYFKAVRGEFIPNFPPKMLRHVINHIWFYSYVRVPSIQIFHPLNYFCSFIPNICILE